MNITYRFLNDSDKQSLLDMLDYTTKHIKSEYWWLPISKETIEHLTDTSWVIFVGAFDNDNLVGVCGLFLNENEFLDYCEALHVSKENSAKIGRCMVKEQYRGNNIMLKLNRVLIDKAKELNIHRVMATVHPDNIVSLNSLKTLGMEVRGLITMYDKFDRLICCIDL